MKIRADYTNEAQWKEISVKSALPDELKCLDEVAHNLWWAWNNNARDLWRKLDPRLYSIVKHNPVLLLGRLSVERTREILKDRKIMRQVREVYADFRKYMDTKPNTRRPSVAYFCMEYGINQVLKIYSGGLGMLAGDYLKEASDSNVDMCAVGFMYKSGYFRQSLSMDGQQIANYDDQDFNSLPITRLEEEDGSPLVISVPMSNFQVHAYVWLVQVGRVKLYLLDTENELNSEYDRPITHALYGGDWENRLKQEILLGIGGVMTLERLGIKKDIYHCNEGHAAFCNLKRLCNYINEGLTFNQAMELVRCSGLYTCHTPVPAGHDYFDEALFGKYMRAYPDQLGITWDEFIGMGRTNPDDHNEKFSMSVFAINTCQGVNGVSKLHGWVSQKMFAPIWKGYFPEETHVGYVTNGVHMPTWTASEWREVYDKYFDPSFLSDQSNEEIWSAIQNVPDEEIWATRMKLKVKLTNYIKEQFSMMWLKNQGDPARVISLLEMINPNVLMIGFCRRFATYKRAHLLFTDLNRLSRIVNNEKYPVQFIFSGKAHPADGAGQGLIKRIYEISQRPEFLGKIIFLEDYDMQLARRLVSGVDIWMNTPTRPLEASGTSGEKAEMNGVVNLSVLDGWWYEGYREGAGWALTDKRTYENQSHQDQLDATTIYSMLENEIIPLYYKKNRQGFSPEWVKVIKNSIAHIAPHYTMKRQLDDYYQKFYTPQAQRLKKLRANGDRAVRELAEWKEAVVNRWDSIRVVEKETSIHSLGIDTGRQYYFKYVIDEAGLQDAVGVEVVVVAEYDGHERVTTVHRLDNPDEATAGRRLENSAVRPQDVTAVHPLEVTGHVGNLYTFEKNFSFDKAGTFRIGVRMYPKHPLLPHRQDFAYVKWLEY